MVTKLVSKLESKLVSNISYQGFSHFLLIDSKLVTNFMGLVTNKLVFKITFSSSVVPILYNVIFFELYFKIKII